jgi:malate dehydrogenase (oxaloacetate-decarboxylating)
MIEFELRSDAQGGGFTLPTPLHGPTLLQSPLFNKGSAFSEEEREAFGLTGLLPSHISRMDEQIERTYDDFQQKPTDMERHIFLRALQDRNETLYYRLLGEHIAEMMPLVYTPVVGAACQSFSHIFRRPRGLFISYPHRDRIEQILDNRPVRQVDVIVVTDGERILGLGDQGVGGMGIPVGKLSLYSLCGGIHPARTLPILLDTGTDNAQRLDDPLYLGWKHPRVRGQEYDDFVEIFVRAVQSRLPNALLQWEDFSRDNAARLLSKYRDRLCTFNDDIQGTAGVTTGTLLAAMKQSGRRLADQRIVILGAGSAACGIAGLLREAMLAEGVSPAEASGRFWLLNSRGLLVEGMADLQEFQCGFVQPAAAIAGWTTRGVEYLNLEEVVRNVRPTVLIGTSGQGGAFTESVVRQMASTVERPIIFPLSNPTSKSEATPADLLAWTEGRAIVATGSPFDPVEINGRHIPIPQCNNSYVFPGVGLGILASGARRVTDGMFMAASRALAETAPAWTDPEGALLPPLTQIRDVSRQIAVAVGEAAQRDGVADRVTRDILESRVAANMWEPIYPRLLPA